MTDAALMNLYLFGFIGVLMALSAIAGWFARWAFQLRAENKNLMKGLSHEAL